MRLNMVVPECFFDTLVVTKLLNVHGIYCAGINHQKSRSQVLHILANQFNQRFAIGIVDDDKEPHHGLLPFRKMDAFGDTQLLKHSTENHYLIIVSPAMEGFVLQDVKATGFSMQQLLLPEDLEGLKKLTKHLSQPNPKAAALDALVSRLAVMNDTGMYKLKNWLASALMENRIG